jgi:hypothetical protein
MADIPTPEILSLVSDVSVLIPVDLLLASLPPLLLCPQQLTEVALLSLVWHQQYVAMLGDADRHLGWASSPESGTGQDICHLPETPTSTHLLRETSLHPNNLGEGAFPASPSHQESFLQGKTAPGICRALSPPPTCL